jgi:hypothetical protein
VRRGRSRSSLRASVYSRTFILIRERHCALARAAQTAVNVGATKSTFNWKKVAVLAFLAVRRRFRCATRQKVSARLRSRTPPCRSPPTRC